MTRATILVGDFARPAFAEGLARRLDTQLGLTVARVAAGEMPRRIAEAAGPVVLILDREVSAAALQAVPEGAPVSVLLIGAGGREVEVRLRDVAATQLDEIVRIAVGAARRTAAWLRAAPAGWAAA